MSKPRPTKITWKGDMYEDGRPVAHLGDYGIPPETLEGDALDALTPQQIAIVRQHPALYRVSEKAEAKAPTKTHAGLRDRVRVNAEPPPETPAEPPVDAVPATEPTDTKAQD